MHLKRELTGKQSTPKFSENKHFLLLPPDTHQGGKKCLYSENLPYYRLIVKIFGFDIESTSHYVLICHCLIHNDERHTLLEHYKKYQLYIARCD